MTEADLHSQLLLSEKEIANKTRRLAFQILEQYPEATPAFVGIQKRGVTLAERVMAQVESEKPGIPMGTLDISLYRDDLDNLGTMPTIESTEIPFEVDGAHIILFDDVLFTGRTIRAAIDCLMDFGRPARIELAVLIDRGNRELPIAPNYVGERVDTTREQYISVRMKGTDDEECIHLLSPKGGTA